jgi:hypothetical protein
LLIQGNSPSTTSLSKALFHPVPQAPLVEQQGSAGSPER